MNLKQLKEKAFSKYAAGQTINMRKRDYHGNIVGRFKAKIVKFLPYIVQCEVNGFIECFTYGDFNDATSIKRESVSLVWHGRNKYD